MKKLIIILASSIIAIGGTIATLYTTTDLSFRSIFHKLQINKEDISVPNAKELPALPISKISNKSGIVNEGMNEIINPVPSTNPFAHSANKNFSISTTGSPSLSSSVSAHAFEVGEHELMANASSGGMGATTFFAINSHNNISSANVATQAYGLAGRMGGTMSQVLTANSPVPISSWIILPPADKGDDDLTELPLNNNICVLLLLSGIYAMCIMATQRRKTTSAADYK